jgi:hypothetical protein
MLVQAAWAAVKTEGRLQARYHKLVRRFGGPKNRAAVKKAILAIARTRLKIAYQVLRSGKPYEDLGADFYSRRESPSSAGPTCCGSWKSSAPAAPLPSSPRRPPDNQRHALASQLQLTAESLSRAARTSGPQRRAYNTSHDPSPTSRAGVRCRAPGRAQFRVRVTRARPQCPAGGHYTVVLWTI